MTDRTIARVTAMASLAGAVAAPIIAIAVQMLVAEKSYPVEIVTGAILGTAFFAVTGALSAFYRGVELRKVLLYSYVFKVLLLLAAALLFPTDGVDRTSFGIGVVSAAVAYVGVQTALLARRRPSQRADDVVE